MTSSFAALALEVFPPKKHCGDPSCKSHVEDVNAENRRKAEEAFDLIAEIAWEDKFKAATPTSKEEWKREVAREAERRRRK